MNEITRTEWQETMAGVSGADLILTDPPYAISRQTGFSNGGVERFRVSMEFGNWDKSEIDIQAFTASAYTALRPGGTAVIWYDVWKVTTLADAMRSAGFRTLRMIEWLKTNPVPLNSGVTYLSGAREIAVTGVRGGGGTFNSEYDSGVYKYPIPSGDRVHPTQKPLELFVDLVRKHSNRGDLVVDPFVGSGTTAEAALSTGRRFVGGDADQKFVTEANRRIREVQEDLF